MRASLLEILVDPVSKSPLTLVDQKVDGGEVIEGALRSAGPDDPPENEFSVRAINK